MTRIEIRHPKEHNNPHKKSRVGGRFLAVGTASEDVRHIEGALEWRGDGHADPAVSRRLFMKPRGGQLHWGILFERADGGYLKAGKWAITVRGQGDSDASAGPYEFYVRPPNWSIEASYPEPGADLTPEWDYFVASGPCTHDLLEARMIPDGGEPIPPDDQDSPPGENWWWAFFPELQNGTYELKAVDTHLHYLMHPVTGLIVDRRRP